jgi:hypothetical protein
MSTYAKSCNRTLNTNRHIESSVGRLFSGDSCILVPHLNFTNKAPPIIKTLTNFGLSRFFAHPLSSLVSSHHTKITHHHTSSHHHLRVFVDHDDPPSHHPDIHFSAMANKIISSARIHRLRNTPRYRSMCGDHQDLSWLRNTPPFSCCGVDK